MRSCRSRRFSARRSPGAPTGRTSFEQLFARYVEAKQSHAVLDYDDLLLYWAHAATEPSIGADMGERFDHVLIDEYQDTNRLQAAILSAMKPNGEGVTVVGDDAQSIYAFRAATVRNILDFPATFGTPARVVTLERNYRSTQPILAAANAVIELAAERFTKNLWSDRVSDDKPQLVSVADDRDQADCVVERILENREVGMRLKSQAVLFRASHHSAVLELELTRRNIPFVKFGGLKFLDAAHVKDVLACLRWAENPRDRVAGFRLLQLLPGFGPATAGRVLDRMAEATDPVRAARRLRAAAELPAHGATFAEMMGRLHLRASGWPAELGLVRSWYEPHLARSYDDAHIRAADLLQLEQIASGYPSRERFLTELTLDPPDAVSDEAGVPHLDEDYLILSTIHSAKGQEWASVFVLNCVDGCIPSDLGTGTSEEIEEERRLLYVAMTRAKDQLSIMIPQRFYKSQQASGRATATSTRSARASFRMRCCSISRCGAGRWWRRRLRGRRCDRRHRSTLARACGACGASRVVAYPNAIAAVPIRTTMPNARATPHRNWRANAGRNAWPPQNGRSICDLLGVSAARLPCERG